MRATAFVTRLDGHHADGLQGVRRGPLTTGTETFDSESRREMKSAAGATAADSSERVLCSAAPSSRADRGNSRKALRSSPASRLRSEEHTSELQSHVNLVCRLLLEKKKKKEI